VGGHLTVQLALGGMQEQPRRQCAPQQPQVLAAGLQGHTQRCEMVLQLQKAKGDTVTIQRQVQEGFVARGEAAQQP
jgi:hypothetical protein